MYRARKYKPLISDRAACICVSLTSRQAAFGGQSNGLPIAIFVAFVVKTDNSVRLRFSVPPVKPLPP